MTTILAVALALVTVAVAALLRELTHGDPPSTELGEIDAGFRRRTGERQMASHN